MLFETFPKPPSQHFSLTKLPTHATKTFGTLFLKGSKGQDSLTQLTDPCQIQRERGKHSQSRGILKLQMDQF